MTQATEIMMSRMKWTAVGSPRAFGYHVQRAGLQHLSFRTMRRKSTEITIRKRE